GAAALRWLGVRPHDGVAHAVIACGLGFIAQYAAVTLLAVAQGIRPWTLWAVLLIPVPLGLADLRTVSERLRAGPPPLPRDLVGLLIGLFLLAYGVIALSPEIGIDPLTYHLVIPREYLAHGGATSVTDNFMRIFPPAMSMQYLLLLG